MRWWPPFNGAQPGSEDGDGFFQTPTTTPSGDGSTSQSGSKVIAKDADRVTVLFPTPLVLGTPYTIEANAENIAVGDPAEQIYPTQLISRNSSGAGEIGFTYLLNAAPSVGSGIIGTEGELSYVQFNWSIRYDA